jgi:hypothetical protein
VILSPPTSSQFARLGGLARYAERYFHRSGHTEFPTVRQCARALRMRQAEIEELANGDDRLMLTGYLSLPLDPLGDLFVEVLHPEGVL